MVCQVAIPDKPASGPSENHQSSFGEILSANVYWSNEPLARKYPDISNPSPVVFNFHPSIPGDMALKKSQQCTMAMRGGTRSGDFVAELDVWALQETPETQVGELSAEARDKTVLDMK